MASVVSVNVGVPREIEFRGHTISTSIWKHPVAGAVAVTGVNLAGDDQSDRRVHGGFDKAVYAYAREDYDWWSAQRGAPIAPGTFGDNLTTEGVDVTGARAGDRWRIGTAEFEVSQPRFPCYKLGIRMDDDSFVDAFQRAMRPGAYLRIVTEGVIAAGDEIVVITTDAGGPTLRDTFSAWAAR